MNPGLKVIAKKSIKNSNIVKGDTLTIMSTSTGSGGNFMTFKEKAGDYKMEDFKLKVSKKEFTADEVERIIARVYEEVAGEFNDYGRNSSAYDGSAFAADKIKEILKSKVG